MEWSRPIDHIMEHYRTEGVFRVPELQDRTF